MIKAWGVTDKGAVRQQNQDAYYLDVPSGGLAVVVVCDGMGGAKAGNVASTLAVESFVDALRTRAEEAGGSLPAEPDEVLQEAAEISNSAVYYRASIDPDCGGMGTTMVAALVEGRLAHILNIGDSRCYHVTGEGISRVTRDHSVVEDLVQRGEITPEEARLHPRKNLITRALGAEEHIRADLYHRINEFTLRMPELRQMRGDIMLFADFFLDAANRELDKRIVGFDPQAAAAMTRYDWPGNLRQMKNAVMSATLLCTGDYITCRELPAELSEAPETPAVPLRNPAGEEEQIRRALTMAGGNKSQAAKLLGIDRKTLYNKLHLYGIE